MTEFKFNKEVSKIIDFYRLVEFSTELGGESSGIYEKIKKSGYLMVVSDFYESHKDLAKNSYLMTYGGLNPFSLSNLFDMQELNALKTIEEAREVVLARSDEELRKMFIESLVEEDELGEYLENPLKVFDVISACTEDDLIKGKLSNAISKPREAVEEYLDFLFLFRDDFEKVYNENEKAVEKKGEEYERLLNEKGASVVHEFFKDFFDVGFNFLENFAEVDLYVSLFTPIGVGSDNACNFLILGIYADKNASLKRELKEGIKIQLFKNLGDVTRFKILGEIGRGINTNKELATACGVKKPTISYHMNHLISAGMITLDDEGRYKINKEGIIGILRDFIEDVEGMK